MKMCVKIYLLRLIAVAVLLLCSGLILAQDADADSVCVVTGIVKDRQSNKVVKNASVTLKGTNIGTVTNSDGLFSLKLPANEKRRIEVSHIGYNSTLILNRLPGTPITVFLSPNTTVLDEVVVLSGDPREIFTQALSKVPENYSNTSDLLTAFYRETIQKGRRYTGVSEAVVAASKSSYRRRSITGDRVKLLKGRKLMSQSTKDTLAIKVMGGPMLAHQFDFVKNGELPFRISDLYYYEFKMEDVAFLDDRRQYVVSFQPRLFDDEFVLFGGKAYIDAECLAFTRVELELDMRDKGRAVHTILRKKPAGLRFNPLSVTFVISYRNSGDRYFLNYVRNEMRFKCDWKRRILHSTYTACTEMVVVDNERDVTPVFTRKESFGNSQVFSDIVDEYWDEDFWKDYNIIEPTESLEKAVKRLKRK